MLSTVAIRKYLIDKTTVYISTDIGFLSSSKKDTLLFIFLCPGHHNRYVNYQHAEDGTNGRPWFGVAVMTLG